MAARAPSYRGLKPASKQASAVAKGASKKQDTKPELALRRELWRSGARYRKNMRSLPGRPDAAFIGAKVVVFCDGDFWHGKNWAVRKARLERGSNAPYWVAKIERNMERDAANNAALERDGWTALRFWESDLTRDVLSAVETVLRTVAAHHRRSPKRVADSARRT